MNENPSHPGHAAPSSIVARQRPSTSNALDARNGTGPPGPAGEYGRVVHVDLEKHDRRILTPTPWGCPSWKRGYSRRFAMEGIYSRVDDVYRMEKYYIRFMPRM